MINKYSLFVVSFWCAILSGFGQVTIFSENIGTGTTTQSIAATTFQNSGTLSFAGDAETRVTTISTGYTGASGGKNVFITNSFNTFFEISGINTIGYNSLTLSLGHYKSTNLSNNQLAIEVSSNGTTYTQLTYTRPTGSGTAEWILISPTGTIPSTNNLRIRFRQTSTTAQFRIDDIKLTGIITSTNFVDYCNLQFPQSGNISVGSSIPVYARVYEAGVTEAAGQGAAISGWIGYSTTNSDPATWTNWVLATYNTDAGNNDEYVANIGAALPSGTYYYASRFQISGGPYRYGGYNAGGGGIWDGTTNVSGVLSVDTPDFVNLQFPGVGTINLGNAFAVYGQVYEQGVTPGVGQGAGITAQIGYSTTNTDPNSWTNWIAGTYNAGCTNTCNTGQNDEYSANIGGAITTPGTYYYATRFRLNGGAWLYGGILSDGSAGSFWNGTTYISGVLTVNAPNIDIERNTNASITNGSTPNTGNNTVFATTIIGNSTAPKTYFIHNEGTSNLVVTSLTSSNPAEFPLTLVPNTDFPSPTLPLTIAPGKLAEFEIFFSPNSILPTPTRTSTITVRSNDTFKDPYTFGVRGTADCAAGALTITPISGPVGTIVTVTGSNFGASTSARFNGTSVTTLSVLSSTMIEVTVPSGATTGSLEVTNQIGCKSSAFFSIINNQITSCQGTGTLPSALFISEVTDKGSGSHSYIEIYNGTGATINMGTLNYQVRIHNNGATSPTATINLTGTIANNTVKVVAIGGTDANSPEGGYTASFFSGTGGINDDDHVRLYRGSTWVDLWGETTGNAFTIASKDYVYRRKNSGIIVPSTTWNPSDWEAFTPVDYSNIGTHDFSVGIPPTVTLQPSAPVLECDLVASITVAGAEGYTGAGNTQALAYQWYYNAPNTNTWVEITSAATNYTGQQSPTLNILNTLNLNEYQYYCQIRESGATCFKATNAVRLIVVKSTWNGTAWSPVPPNSGTIAVIDGNYNTGIGGQQTSFTACQLIVNATFTLNVANNTYVEILNNVTNDGIIYVDRQGSFVQISDTGTITLNNSAARNTVSKYTTPLINWYDYTYWSSPLVSASIETALAPSRASRRFGFNASLFNDVLKETLNTGTFTTGQDDIDDDGDDWFNYPNGIMTPGLGYAATHNTTGFIAGNSGFQYIFEGSRDNGGVFNNGNVKADIYIDPSVIYNNWNLIGNPYPSAINALTFFQTTSSFLEGVIYLWSHSTDANSNASGNQNQNFSQDDYAIINYTGGTAAGEASATGSAIPNGFIPSGQGFFVIGKKTGASTGAGYYNRTVFTNAMRSTTNNNQFFRQAETEGTNKLWLNLTSDNGVFNQILVGYIPTATNQFDGMHFDAPRNLSTANSAILYSVIPDSDHKLAIQGKNPMSLNLEERIPLGFQTLVSQPTNYKLSIEQLEGDFMNSNTLFLKDDLLNITHNLSTSDYTFTSQIGEFNNRFEIVFQNETLSVIENEITPDGLSIIELSNGQVKFLVGNNLDILTIEIIDMLGRTLYQLKGNSSSEVYELSNLSQAAYIAKVSLSNGQVIIKRAVKRL